MSTRYVYELYNTGVKKEYVESKVLSALGSSVITNIRAFLCNEFEAKSELDMTGNQIAVYRPTGAVNEYFDVPQTSGESTVKECYLYKYCTISAWRRVTDEESRYIESYLISLSESAPKLFWHTHTGSNQTYTIWNSDASRALAPEFDGTEKGFLTVEGGKLEKGGTLLYTQTTNSKTQEAGAFYSNGWKWRSYKGADTIDPYSVSYSKTELEAGDTVIVSLSPRQPTYGGTIYYQYQYSINGGNTWTNAGGKTTATSKTVTIPEGAEQFQARVRASDGWGFTSTTYVAGANIPVSQIKAYATVGGKLRAGAEMYATVGGKIRQVQKGYVTVGGKIRKLF